MDGMGGGLRPVDSFRYSATWFPTVPVQGQAANFEMLAESLSFTHPLWTPVHRDSTLSSLSGGVRNSLIDSEAVLPNTGQTIPRGALERQSRTPLCAAAQRRLAGERRAEHRIGERPSVRLDP